MRMSDAEKKAAALPPKLTVPMILFFLPVIFVIILGPSIIRGDEDQLTPRPTARHETGAEPVSAPVPFLRVRDVRWESRGKARCRSFR